MWSKAEGVDGSTQPRFPTTSVKADELHVDELGLHSVLTWKCCPSSEEASVTSSWSWMVPVSVLTLTIMLSAFIYFAGPSGLCCLFVYLLSLRP